jgi:acyl-coenzyme A thioesterase PaaI-like protein
MCFLCGTKNQSSLNARFYNVENESGERVVLAIAHPQEIHQSYPNRMHGGVIAAMLDETIGRAMELIEPDVWAVTIDLAVKYRKPVPLDREIYIEGRITNNGTRAFDGEGKAFVKDGEILATATGRFLRVSLVKAFPNTKLTDENYYLVNEKLPKFINV